MIMEHDSRHDWMPFHGMNDAWEASEAGYIHPLNSADSVIIKIKFPEISS